jgi:hypothetical protein
MARTAVRGGELGGDPVGRNDRVGVGGGDQGIWFLNFKEPIARGLHARAPGVAGSAPRSFQEVQAELRVLGGDLAGADPGPVGATVEDEQDLVLLVRDALLRGERSEARPDQGLLVAGGDDDGAPESGARRRDLPTSLRGVALSARRSRSLPRSRRRGRA